MQWVVIITTGADISSVCGPFRSLSDAMTYTDVTPACWQESHTDCQYRPLTPSTDLS